MIRTSLDPPAYTIAEAAERLSLSEATAYRLARRGELPGAARIGRSWRVDARRLDAELFDRPEGPPHGD